MKWFNQQLCMSCWWYLPIVIKTEHLIYEIHFKLKWGLFLINIFTLFCIAMIQTGVNLCHKFISLWILRLLFQGLNIGKKAARGRGEGITMNWRDKFYQIDSRLNVTRDNRKCDLYWREDGQQAASLTGMIKDTCRHTREHAHIQTHNHTDKNADTHTTAIIKITITICLRIQAHICSTTIYL